MGLEARLRLARLYLCTDAREKQGDLESFLHAAFAGGVDIVQIRQNRLLGLNAHRDDDLYVDRQAVAEEVAFSRKLCAKHNWPLIDVTRRSIEETAAAVMALLTERRRQAAS